MKTAHLLALLCTCILSTGRAGDVAVSIRYLQPEGKSHAAIFLFQNDGKLIRQLTKPTDSQDVNPAFAPDGKSLIFTRESDKNAKRVLVSLDLAETTTQVVEGDPPAWFKDRAIAKPFGDDAPAADIPAAAATETQEPDTFSTADGAYTILLKPRKGNKAELAEPANRDAFLRVGKEPALIPFTKMPGFVSFWRLHSAAGSPFPPVTEPRIAIFAGAHTSTDGTEFYALDLARQRIVQLSRNGGAIFPWPGHAGFFCTSMSRYEDLGDGRTVNCYYLDRYDEKLERTRFGHPLGQFHGGSIFIPGEKPFNIVDPAFTR